METLIRREIRFHGRVQHVGFRYMASNLAKKYSLTGWVRNEYDGSVSMTVQGAEAGIDQMLLALLHDRYIRIDSYDVTRHAVDPSENSFVVKRR